MCIRDRLALIPFLGWIALFVFTVLEGDQADNKYGPNPKLVDAQA